MTIKPVRFGPKVLFPTVDIGGTNLRVVLADPDRPADTNLIRVIVPTERGVPRLMSALRGALDAARATAEKQGFLVADAIALGTPGRYELQPDGKQLIAARSAQNLEAFPDELAAFDMRAAVAKALGFPETRVFADNDAVAQGRFLLTTLMKDPRVAAELIGSNVVCINPGTGLGGCVLRIASAETFEGFTDSHLSELRLPISFDGSIGRTRMLFSTEPTGKELILRLTHGDASHEVRWDVTLQKEAEALLSGRAIKDLAQAIDGGLRALGVPPPFAIAAEESGHRDVNGQIVARLLEEKGRTPSHDAARFVARATGHALFSLTKCLFEGSAEKAAQFPAWSAQDRARLVGTRHFVLGGGVSSGALGKAIVDEAQKLWGASSGVRFLRAPDVVDDAGALGALSLLTSGERKTLAQTARAEGLRDGSPLQVRLRR